jgi:hypothetical protein
VPDTKINPKGMGNFHMGNAAVAKTNGQAEAEITAKMVVVKNETTPVETKKVENPIISLEKRIQRVNELNILIDKWRKLNEARQNLNEFKLANDGLSSSVIIRDSTGREFKTSQNIVFTTVLQTVQKVLDEKISETEAQINFGD